MTVAIVLLSYACFMFAMSAYYFRGISRINARYNAELIASLHEAHDGWLRAIEGWKSTNESNTRLLSLAKQLHEHLFPEKKDQ